MPTFSKMVSMAATKCALTRRARLSAWAWASAPSACRIFWVAASLSMNRVSAWLWGYIEVAREDDHEDG